MAETTETKETQSGPDLVKETLDIATGKKEVPAQQTVTSTEQKPSTETAEAGITKKEGEVKPTPTPQTPEEVKAEVDKIRKDYEDRLEKERREKKGIYEDLKKSREKLQQTRLQPSVTAPVSATPANVDTYISNATSALKEIGFSEKDIETLKDRAIDDPFAVIQAVTYAIATHIKDKTLKQVMTAETTAETKDLDDRERNLVDEVNKGWETTREKMSQKHPDMIKKGTDGKWVFDEKSPKFIIYDEEANKMFKEEPWLQNSPQFAELVAQRMEMKLLSGKSFEEGQKAEQQRQADVNAGFVATGGRTLPPQSKVELTVEEKAQADKDIRRGLFKDYNEWAQTKNQRVV